MTVLDVPQERQCVVNARSGDTTRVCRSHVKVAMVEGGQDAFLGTLGSQTSGDTWQVEVRLNDTPVKFQIVTVIPTSMHSKLSGTNLRPSQRTLHGPSQCALPVLGQFTGNLVMGDYETHQDMYMYGLDKMHTPLLGQPAIEALGLHICVRSVEQDISPIQRFKELFKGLGKMDREFTIQLKEGAVPFTLTTPHKVAIPLMDSIKAELQRMEKLGVISWIEEPTDWCTGMVVVPRSNKQVRICVDLTKLNENVRRERHQLPAVEQTLAQVAGARVFSKLDANSGFWQIPLSAESATLTTVITPFSRYCFN